MKKKEKILVAMSGGVDSSVAAALLVDKGYDVTGAFMINFDSNKEGVGSCYTNDYRDAVRVSAKLGIPLLKLDFQKEYKKYVLDYMYKEYEKGKTPNPDVMCNLHIKFGVWLEEAKNLGFSKLATGHYASLREEFLIFNLKFLNNFKYFNDKKNKYHLEMAKDKNKDQTYFLHQLNQEQLSHTLFPLGNYTKDEVRKIAKKFDLPTAEKEESMGICFVGEVSMKDFLQDKVKVKKGEIFTSSGEKIGEHDGLAFYTIGQRHGFTQTGGDKPLFVVDKDFKNNRLIVGYENDDLLYKSEAEVGDVHWIGQEPKFPLKCKVRMRHRQELKDCIIDGNKIAFKDPERAVTPGQFAVFYLKKECLGGGIVK